MDCLLRESHVKAEVNVLLIPFGTVASLIDASFMTEASENAK